MTEQLTKETLIRLAWIAALRSQGHRKCEGTYHDRETGAVCALGLLQEVARLSPGDIICGRYGQRGEAAAGLTAYQCGQVILMNDGITRYGGKNAKRTFSEIADVIEGWFKK